MVPHPVTPPYQVLRVFRIKSRQHCSDLVRAVTVLSNSSAVGDLIGSVVFSEQRPVREPGHAVSSKESDSICGLGIAGGRVIADGPRS